jgi:hypothetical protein
MAAVQVEAARIPDRDRLLGELREQGLDANPVDEIGIEVRCGEDAESACAEVLGQVEGMIMSIGAPFVPLEHEGTVYIRPPVS